MIKDSPENYKKSNTYIRTVIDFLSPFLFIFDIKTVGGSLFYLVCTMIFLMVCLILTANSDQFLVSSIILISTVGFLFVGLYKYKSFLSTIIKFIVLLFISSIIISTSHYPDRDYNLKFDYVNNNIINLENNDVIDNIGFFNPSFRNSIVHEDIFKIEKDFYNDKKYFCLRLYDEIGNHFIMTKKYFGAKFYLKEIYFNKKDFSIKTIYCDKVGEEVFTLEKNMEVGNFYERLYKYYNGINKIKVSEDIDKITLL